MFLLLGIICLVACSILSHVSARDDAGTVADTGKFKDSTGAEDNRGLGTVGCCGDHFDPSVGSHSKKGRVGCDGAEGVVVADFLGTVGVHGAVVFDHFVDHFEEHGVLVLAEGLAFAGSFVLKGVDEAPE